VVRRVLLAVSLLAPLVLTGRAGAGDAACVPTQGVVQVHRSADGDHFQPSAIGDNGLLENLSLLGHTGQPPLVSAWTTCGDGAWAVTPEGHVYIGGDAGHFGDTQSLRLNRPIVGMSPTSTGRGYWLVASDGGIFAFGDARFLGSTGAIRLNQPIVAMATTPSGRGYWLAASDGGLFTFGDAAFFGSMGGRPLNEPIVGMVPTPSGRGYWMVARDGGVFTFGDAVFRGSTASAGSTVPVVGMIPNPAGYTIVDEEGTITAFPSGTTTSGGHEDHAEDEGGEDDDEIVAPPLGEGPIISLEDPRVTPEQRAAAQDLIDRTRVGMRAFPDEQSLWDAGYASVGDSATGYEHFVNWALIFDSKEMDETAIESVVLVVEDDGTKRVASAMYILSPGRTMQNVPYIAGELTTFHDHNNLCFEGGVVVGLARNGVCEDGVLLVTPPMLHVWMVDHPCGPFAGIETSGHGSTCAVHVGDDH